MAARRRPPGARPFMASAGTLFCIAFPCQLEDTVTTSRDGGKGSRGAPRTPEAHCGFLIGRITKDDLPPRGAIVMVAPACDRAPLIVMAGLVPAIPVRRARR